VGRCTLPTQDALIEHAARPARVVIDQERLLALALDPAAYGLALGQMLLADPLLAQLVARVCVSWSEMGGSMRRWPSRGGLRERPDFWAPVLFQRLLSGRLWLMSAAESETPEELLERMPTDEVPAPQTLPAPHRMRSKRSPAASTGRARRSSSLGNQPASSPR
jgi:hypothetical protein